MSHEKLKAETLPLLLLNLTRRAPTLPMLERRGAFQLRTHARSTEVLSGVLKHRAVPRLGCGGSCWAQEGIYKNIIIIIYYNPERMTQPQFHLALLRAIGGCTFALPFQDWWFTVLCGNPLFFTMMMGRLVCVTWMLLGLFLRETAAQDSAPEDGKTSNRHQTAQLQ